MIPIHRVLSLPLPLPKTSVSTINPNIINSQQSPSCMDMTDVIMKYTKHQKETQNLSKKLQTITFPSTLQSARNLPTHNANPWTAVHPVHSILTITNLQLGSCFSTSYRPKSWQWEDLQYDRACVAEWHPQQQQRSACIQQRDQQPGFWWLQAITAAWESCFDASFRTFGSLHLLLRRFLDLGAASQHHQPIPPQCHQSHVWLLLGGCHLDEGICGHHA